ncbi:MAG TPA: ComEC/Rec2 family competence protein, partial [Gemmatimonadales bacterium]
MRPPILWITIAFAAGLWFGLEPARGAWYAGLPLLAGAAFLVRRAPVAAALGLAAVAGLLWGEAALARRDATCAGIWGRGIGDGGAVAAAVQLVDPVSDLGGLASGAILAPACGGSIDVRWPEGHAAHGGTTWLVAGRYAGDAARGVLVARRVRLLDPQRRGRGALRDRIAARSAELFGTRAPLVDAMVLARRSELDPAVRERFARSGLAHLLAIAGLHVGFLAGWFALFLRLAGLPPRWRVLGAASLAFAYVWLLGFPAPATRAALLLGFAGLARARERVVRPYATLALAALAILLGDPWAARSVGLWLSVAAVAAISWSGRALARAPAWIRALGPAAATTIGTAPISAFAFGTVAPIGVLANLVAVPVAGIAVPGLVLAITLAPWWHGAARLIAAGAGLGLEVIDLIAKASVRIPGGHWVGQAGWPAAALWFGVVAALWWLWHSPRRPWLISARAL